jgi:hypothetical protein
VDPANEGSVNQYFLGKMDDIRLYNVPLGSEDVFHLFKGDSGLLEFQPPRTESLRAATGSLVKITPPTLPVIAPAALTYGNEIVSLDLGRQVVLLIQLPGYPLDFRTKFRFPPRIFQESLPGIRLTRITASVYIQMFPMREMIQLQSRISLPLIPLMKIIKA